MKKLSLLVCIAFAISTNSFAMIQLNGAGASFPYPIYSKWFSEYQKGNKEVRFNYRPIGSGGGVRQVIAETVDFGASDVPLKKTEIAKLKGPVLEVPMVKGAVVVVYNLDLKEQLTLDGETLANIYLGKISKWNDPAISKLNPKVKLPFQDIMVTRRADSSGTTAIFTQYLVSVSDFWKKNIGTGKAVKWPTGFGGKGNDGVTGIVRENKGSIGYVEMAYAETNKLQYVSLKTREGKVVLPKLKNISNDLYPIAAKTYMLVPISKNEAKRNEMVKFIKWAFKNGDQSARDLHYAPLSLKTKDEYLKKLEEL